MVRSVAGADNRPHAAGSSRRYLSAQWRRRYEGHHFHPIECLRDPYSFSNTFIKSAIDVALLNDANTLPLSVPSRISTVPMPWLYEKA